MTIEEIYEKYKHLDKLLSDKEWLPDTFQGSILYDLWQAIKNLRKEKVSKKCQPKKKNL